MTDTYSCHILDAEMICYGCCYEID